MKAQQTSRQRAEQVPTVRVQHGAFVFNLPSTWSDESTLSFVGRAESVPSIPLAAKAPAEQGLNFQVEFLNAEQHASPNGYLDAAIVRLKQVGTQCVELRRFHLEMLNVSAPCAEMKLIHEGLHVRQIRAVAPVGRILVVAIASSPESCAAKEMPKLIRLVQQIELHPQRAERNLREIH